MNMILERGAGKLTEVSIPAQELSLRLGTKEVTPETEVSIQELFKVADCGYCYVKVPLSFLSSQTIQIGDFTVTSQALAKNLQGCHSCFLLAVTIGPGVDRLIARLGVSSPARQFMTDAAASALVEGVCDRVCDKICKEHVCHPRFSPGFGDFLLEYQTELLRLTNAPKEIGLKLTDTLFLTPSKSVTAVIGVED